MLDPVPPPPAVPMRAPFVGLPAPAMALASLAFGLWIVLGEVGRLSGDVLDTAGRSWPFATLMGPGRLFSFSASGWRVELPPGSYDGWQSLVYVYTVADLLFIVTYVLLAARLLRERGGNDRFGRARTAVYAVAIVDVTEDLLALYVAARRGRQPAPDWVSQLLVFASTLKWALVVGALILVVRVLLTPVGADLRRSLRRFGRGLYVQRFSVLAILPVAVLSVVPGPGLLDQFPDAERQWVDGPAGWRFLLFASVALVLLVLALFFLGRWRSDQAWRESSQPPGTDDTRVAVLWLWLLGPVVLVALALSTRLAHGTPRLGPLALFCSVPLVVALASWARRKWSPPDPKLRWMDVEHLQTVIRVGDAIAVATLSLAAIGLVRSFAGPYALLFKPWHRQAGAVYVVVAVLGGLLFAALPWLVQNPVRRWLHAVAVTRSTAWGPAWLKAALASGAVRAAPGLDAPPPDPSDTPMPAAWPPVRHHGLRLSLLVGSLVVLLLLGLFPVWMSHMAGFLACAVLALASVVLTVGVSVAYVRDTRPPELFYACGFELHSAPVVALLVLAALLASWPTDGPISVHGVRGLPANDAAAQHPVLTDRPDLATVFAHWLAQPQACRQTIPVNGHQIGLRPMLMVAGEGGGIRATYWTALGMERIGLTPPSGAAGDDSRPTTCGAGATLFSGGASGGAVGLGVARFTKHPVADVTSMAEPDALAAGAVGLLIRDVLAATTGVPLPSYGGYPGSVEDPEVPPGSWLDRAGLMETVWQSQSKALSSDYLPAGDATTASSTSEGLTGELILTSTSVAGGCRAFVSQVRLSDTPPPLLPTGNDQSASIDPNCSAASGPGPYGFDLFASYGPDLGTAPKAPGGLKCLGDVKASTAAMLASRFPYVTPSGVVGPCGPWTRQQLVDGGYTENSGLGTIVDLASQWQPLVRAQDAAVLAWATSTSGQAAAPPSTDFVYPVVVYLDNGIGNDVTPPTQSTTPELPGPACREVERR